MSANFSAKIMSKIDKTSPFWEELAKVCTSPGHFLRCAMAVAEIDSSEVLSKAINVSSTTIRLYVLNRINVTPKNVTKIADVLGFDKYLFAKIQFDYKEKK